MIENYDEENPTSASEVKAAGDKGLRYISVKTSIKEDLQAIFEMQKEVGQAIWTLHKLTASLNVGANAHNIAFVQTHEALAELVEDLKTKQGLIQKKLDELSETTDERLVSIDHAVQEATAATTTHQTKVGKEWDKIMLAADYTLKANGVDPRTLIARDEEVARDIKERKARREKISSALVSLVVTVVGAVILWAYGKATASNQQETHNATTAILNEIKEIAASTKKSQKALDDHVSESKSKPESK